VVERLDSRHGPLEDRLRRDCVQELVHGPCHQAELTGSINWIDPVRQGAQDGIPGVHRRWSCGSCRL